MRRILNSCRFYFWPLIVANAAAATYAAGGNVRSTMSMGFVLCLLASFGFLVNDLSDRKIDRANHAGHFEDSNNLTLTFGALSAATMCGVAMFIARSAGPVHTALAVAIALVLLTYSHVLRRMLLVPNLATAVVASSPTWAPLVLVESGGRAWQWWQACAVVLLLTAREMFMDIRDRQGDVAGGRRTLPTVIGADRCASVAARLTGAGLLSLGLAVAVGLPAVSHPAQAGAFALTAVMALVLLRDTRQIVMAGDGTRTAIQRYVYRSRLVMALVPVFALLLT